jgi:hypothetical protein
MLLRRVIYLLPKKHVRINMGGRFGQKTLLVVAKLLIELSLFYQVNSRISSFEKR